jgi:hypothetical protein
VATRRERRWRVCRRGNSSTRSSSRSNSVRWIGRWQRGGCHVGPHGLRRETVLTEHAIGGRATVVHPVGGRFHHRRDQDWHRSLVTVAMTRWGGGARVCRMTPRHGRDCGRILIWWSCGHGLHPRGRGRGGQRIKEVREKAKGHRERPSLDSVHERICWDPRSGIW